MTLWPGAAEVRVLGHIALRARVCGGIRFRADIGIGLRPMLLRDASLEPQRLSKLDAEDPLGGGPASAAGTWPPSTACVTACSSGH